MGAAASEPRDLYRPGDEGYTGTWNRMGQTTAPPGILCSGTMREAESGRCRPLTTARRRDSASSGSSSSPDLPRRPPPEDCGPQGRSAAVSPRGDHSPDHPLRTLAHAIMAAGCCQHTESVLPPAISSSVGRPELPRQKTWSTNIAAKDLVGLFLVLARMKDVSSAQDMLCTISACVFRSRASGGSELHAGGAVCACSELRGAAPRRGRSTRVAADDCKGLCRSFSTATMSTTSCSSAESSSVSSSRSSNSWASTPACRAGSPVTGEAKSQGMESDSWEQEFLFRLNLEEEPETSHPPPGAQDVDILGREATESKMKQTPPTSQEMEFLLRMALDEILEQLQGGSTHKARKLIEEAQFYLPCWNATSFRAMPAG